MFPKKLLYIRGQPGTGKITVARILQARLGWKLFWLHDLDSVCAIVGRYPIPRLMDKISEAVLAQLMEDGHDIIYVRPSRDAETVEGVRALAKRHDYRTLLVGLRASYDTMLARIVSRDSNGFRARSKLDLDAYLAGRPGQVNLAGECVVVTDSKTPEQVADEIQGWAGLRDGSD